MEFKGQRRKDIQETFLVLLKEKYKIKYTWQTGDKAKIIMIAVIVSDTMSEHDDFDRVYRKVYDYMEHELESWSKWEAAGIHNVVGYIANKQRIGAFLASKGVSQDAKVAAIHHQVDPEY